MRFILTILLIFLFVGVVGFEPTKAKPADLQSAADLQLCCTPIFFVGGRGIEPRSPDFQSGALTV